jgi:DNA-binding NarL/FixJ family response regulator
MGKIVIVDDNIFLQKAIAEKLSFFDYLKCKFTANDGLDLLEKLAHNHNVDLILMDIEMPKMSGIEATSHIKTKYPHIKIIMLTAFDNDENIFKSIKAGADGYLLKEVNPQALHDGITDTLKGGATMTPSIALKTLKLFRNPILLESKLDTECVQLTSREIEVLDQLSKGLQYHKIADNLIVSIGTVRKHVENIYKKLQVHNKLEAIQKAKENNIL